MRRVKTVGRVVLRLIVLSCAVEAWSLELVKDPTILASIHDEPRDGLGDSFNDSELSGLLRETDTQEDRAVQEYDIQELADLTIDAAFISGRIVVNNFADNGVRTFDFQVYPGNGYLDVSDFEAPAVTVDTGAYAPPVDTELVFSVNVTDVVRDLIEAGVTHVGFKVDCTSNPNFPNILLGAPDAVLHVFLDDPSCGNGDLEPGEQCDDGNVLPGDGCDESCLNEGPCGDGVLGGTEQCDDGNDIPGDGCEEDCTFSEIDVGKIYFSQSSGADESDISSIDPNGSNIQTVVEDAQADSLRTDIPAGKMYWMGDDGIQRANLDGSDVETVLLVSGTDLKIDHANGKLYWVHTSSGEIRRADLDGSDVEVAIAGLLAPRGIALAGGKIYWVEDGLDLVRRANLDGSDVRNLAQTDGAFPRMMEIDPVLAKMYWVDGGGLRRADIDGGHVEEVWGGGAIGLAIAPGEQIYWTFNGGGEVPAPGVIYRANPDGSDRQVVAEIDSYLIALTLIDASNTPPDGEVPAGSFPGLLTLLATLLTISTWLIARRGSRARSGPAPAA